MNLTITVSAETFEELSRSLKTLADGIDQQLHSALSSSISSTSEPVALASATPTQLISQPIPAQPVPVSVPTAPSVVTPPVSSPVTPPSASVPTSAPAYTLEMISMAGLALMDAGKIDALTALLAKYNVDALTSLDPSLYGAMAMDLRALGAQI